MHSILTGDFLPACPICGVQTVEIHRFWDDPQQFASADGHVVVAEPARFSHCMLKPCNCLLFPSGWELLLQANPVSVTWLRREVKAMKKITKENRLIALLSRLVGHARSVELYGLPFEQDEIDELTDEIIDVALAPEVN